MAAFRPTMRHGLGLRPSLPSNKNIAEHYTREAMSVLTGLDSAKVPMLKRSVTAALESLYSAIDKAGQRPAAPVPPAPSPPVSPRPTQRDRP
jgi:hypothetical protein